MASNRIEFAEPLDRPGLGPRSRSTDGSLGYVWNRKMLQKMHAQHKSQRASFSRGSFESERTPLKARIEESEEFEQEDGNGEAAPRTTVQAIKEIVLGKGIVSLCLLAIPFSLVAVYGGWSDTWIFWLNFVVLIPLASILGDFTEEVALHTNETTGGLINASFGNAVEVVVAIQALLANEIRVVQASMLGSIFSNLLLVLGCCFFFGGLKYKEQSFNSKAASANMGLLALSSIALVLPTPFAQYYELHDEHVLIVSRIAALFLIFMYAQLLIFQLRTHAEIFSGEEGDEVELASLSMTTSCVGLLVVTLMVAVFSEYLVASIEGFTEASGFSRTFVGLILLPIVGNAVEHISAISVAMKDKMDLASTSPATPIHTLTLSLFSVCIAVGIAVGSCTQISLFVVPLTVLCGWAFEKDMTLNFPIFELTLYVLSVFTVSVLCANSACNWLEGSLLVTTYCLIAVGFWFENVRDAY